MAEWSGVLNTTIRNYIREVENDVMRNRKLLALLNSKGRVTYNWSGDQMEWRLKYKRSTMQGMADADTLTFSRINRHKKANLDWRGYAATDSVTKKEKEMNKGKEAIVNRFNDMTTALMEDIEENFGDELYIDGNASGNEKRLHGIESFMGVSGTTAVSGSVAMSASDTYASLATDLGNYGGSWTGNWPKGKGSPEYDFYTPLILDITSTLATASGGWASATATWAARCLEAIRFGIIHSSRNKSKRGMLDTVLMEAEYYRVFVEQLAAKEHINIERAGGPKTGLTSLGFTDTTNYEGCDVTWEYGVPASVVYGFNTDQMEIRSLQKQMFVPEGPEYDIASQSHRFSIDFYGNMVFRPRYFFKIGSYGSNGA